MRRWLRFAGAAVLIASLAAACSAEDDSGGVVQRQPPTPIEAPVPQRSDGERPATALVPTDTERVEVVAAVVPPISISYTVLPGDTLAKIADAFRTTTSVLVALNEIADPNTLTLGQVLLVGESEGVALRPAAPLDSALIEAEVVSITDGDTIRVRLADGVVEPVRYIGIDTPDGADPFRQEATDRNAQLLAGGIVFLEADASDRDRFSRLLRYVWVRDVTGRYSLISATLVAEGLAQAATFPPDVRHDSLFAELQDAARATRLGLWADFADDATACSPAYPSVCIPPPPPDLDCSQIPFRRFTVLPPDPHLFDGNLDGLGCER